jgi:putative sigma-54 modulation protein
MNLVFNSKNYNLSGYLRQEVEDRFTKLEKYFKEGDPSVSVLFKGEKNQLKKVEITVSVHNSTLRSEVSDFDVRVAIDKAIDKIERQIVKHKEKLQPRSADSIRFEGDDGANEASYSRIVKNKQFELRPMTSEEACFQLELLEHSFYVFQNEDTEKVCVVYKRNDGDYGLIEPSL